MQNTLYDVCIIGSGAGGGAVAYELATSGFQVALLEKGEFYKNEEFSKDELSYCRRDIITPNLKDEFHLIEMVDNNHLFAIPTYKNRFSFWNGNIVGGSTNFMSGFFHRMHPKDFKPLQNYKKIKNSNIANWPISYNDLEPFYEKTERVVGISGKTFKHKFEPPRSTKNFPYPPTLEHPIVKIIDKTLNNLGIKSLQTPRAILPHSINNRDGCYYSNYCGSYGCNSGAKGSSRVALIEPALKSGNLTLITNAFVKKLHEKNHKVIKAEFVDHVGKNKSIRAKIFVLAAQAVESCRLLLNSKSKNFPNGLANNSNQVGKNLLFSAGGIVSGEIDKSVMDLKELMIEGFFINRTIKDWYILDKDIKGGIVEILFEHANPIAKANRQKYSNNNSLIWGEQLQQKIFNKFNKNRQLNFEIFVDWTPHDNCFVSVDKNYKDKFGINVAKIRTIPHPHDIKIAKKLAKKAQMILKKLGAKNIHYHPSYIPPPNLQAGGCRFGDDPKNSVLDKNCKTHEIDNLYITDGSFMPTGGSIPYTWTIYANAFRVAEVLKQLL